jgi:hypothetical protein
MKEAAEKLYKELLDDIEKIGHQYSQREKALDKFTKELEEFNERIKNKVQSLVFLIESKDSEEYKALYAQNLPFMEVALPYLKDVAEYYDVRITYRNAVNKMNEEIIVKVRDADEDNMEEFVGDVRKIMRDWFDELDYLASQVNDQMKVVFEDQKIVAEIYNSMLQ